MFLRFVDILTPSHLRMLRQYIGFQYDQKNPSEYAQRFFPEIDGTDMIRLFGYYAQVFKDLINYGLVGATSFIDITTVNELYDIVKSAHTTYMGERFVEFIASPIESDDAE